MKKVMWYTKVHFWSTWIIGGNATMDHASSPNRLQLVESLSQESKRIKKEKSGGRRNTKRENLF